MMRIDSHQHFWKYSSSEYGWISDQMPVLQRDYLPPDLEVELTGGGLDGCIAVQARQHLGENDFLLSLADRYASVLAIVGWAALTSGDVAKDLEALAAHPKMKGLRHIVQDEPDDNYLLRDDFNRGVARLKELDLVYDILIYEKHLPQAIEFVDRHPGQVFVVDHIAKPRIRERSIDVWRDRITELARRQNVYCKISGMVTEAGPEWTEQQLTPYFDTVVEAFGPRRLMYGSDWPVCLLAADYQRWFAAVTDYITRLTEAEQRRILGETAFEAYRL